MICYEKKCIFVHIPKTGGTSIENAIWGSDWSTRTTKQLWMGAVRPHYNKYQTGGLQHLLASQIREEVGCDIFDEYYKFSFVRNPWDKVVSQYLYVKTRKDLLKFMGISRWTPFTRYLDRIQKVQHVQSYEQWPFLCDDHGDLLVDFVGRFEHLQRDFLTVAQRLGLASTELSHAMKSKRRGHYSTFYNPQTAAKVARIYARDIELFEYEFER